MIIKQFKIGCFLVIVVSVLVGCVKSLEKEGVTDTIVYMGRIVDNQNNPIEGISVKITNGTLVHATELSDMNGCFKIPVIISNVNKEYYMLLEDDFGIVKRTKLKGLGIGIYDFGDIVFYREEDILLPIITIGYASSPTLTSVVMRAFVDDGNNFPVIERGFCYGRSSNPTIENDFIVNGGSGTGHFMCVINNIDVQNSIYYVRAYAQNRFGITYSANRVISNENLLYEQLPTMRHAGQLYHIYPDMGSMAWQNAYNACEQLVYAGYDDWYLPSIEELQNILSQQPNLFIDKCYWSQTLWENYAAMHCSLDVIYGCDGVNDRYSCDVIAVRHD